MATLNLGRIKPVFRGAYSGSTAYVVDDIVTHGNESFICIQAHGAGTQATSVTAYWSKLAAKGTDGTDVGTTITAQGDILYRDGSGLQKLAKPASDKVLQNTSGGVLSWIDAPSGVVKKNHHFTMNTRTAGSSSAGDQFTITSAFTPLLPTAGNNDLYVQCSVPTSTDGNDFTGYGLRFSKSGGSDYDFFGRGVQYSDIQSSAHQGVCSQYFNIPAGTIAAGTYTIKLRTESTSSHHQYYNPNSTDEARLATQTQTELMIQEWKN